MKALYFSHDCNARNDPKILMMRSLHGYEGYGWYWAIIEIMREQSNYKIEHSEMGINALAMHLGCERTKFKKFLDDCIEYGLFETDGRHIYTQSLLERMAHMELKSKKAKQSAQARWGKNKQVEQPAIETLNLPVDDGLAKVSTYIQKNGFGMLNAKIANDIMEYLDDGVEADVVIEAINQAIDNNARNWGYCRACLNNWIGRGVKTIEQYNADKEQHKAKHKAGTKQTILERLGGEWNDETGIDGVFCTD